MSPLRREGYVFGKRNGKHELIKVTVSPDESIGTTQTLFNKEDIVLVGGARGTFKGLPIWYEPDIDNLDPNLRAEIQIVGQRRFWKYLGNIELNLGQIAIIGVGGYGLFSWLMQVITAVWGKQS